MGGGGKGRHGWRGLGETWVEGVRGDMGGGGRGSVEGHCEAA